MSDQDQMVQCTVHGPQPVTFVCQHIAESLITGKPVGFYWSLDGRPADPDAWCAECNERLERCGGRWRGVAEAELGLTSLCVSCYFDARRLCLDGEARTASGPA